MRACADEGTEIVSMEAVPSDLLAGGSYGVDARGRSLWNAWSALGSKTIAAKDISIH